MIHRDEIKSLIESSLPQCEAIVKGDDGRHFEAVVVCAEFEGKSMVQQHRQVYDSLGDRMQNDEIHALALRTYTPEQWAKQQNA